MTCMSFLYHDEHDPLAGLPSSFSALKPNTSRRRLRNSCRDPVYNSAVTGIEVGHDTSRMTLRVCKRWSELC